MSEDAEGPARANGAGWGTLANIQEGLTAYRLCENAGDDEGADACRTSLEEMALSVEVRCYGWQAVGIEIEPDEYRILLCWGGPAVQVTGDLGEYNEPATARLEAQDWFIPWSALDLDEQQAEDVLDFARLFYFGE